MREAIALPSPPVVVRSTFGMKKMFIFCFNKYNEANYTQLRIELRHSNDKVGVICIFLPKTLVRYWIFKLCALMRSLSALFKKD